VSVPHNPIQERIGHFVTKLMMRKAVRRTAFGRRTYARMYLVGKAFAERRERLFFRRHLRPGMTVVDMGANVGFYTVQFSKLVGASGSVYAFEPDPLCRDILRHRVGSLPSHNVRVESAALGEAEGEAILYCSNRDRAENRTYPFEPGVPVETERVRVSSLDAYCDAHAVGRIDAIKIDVEGAEVSVLRGMRGIMATNPPAWMFIEFCPVQLLAAGATAEAFWETLDGDAYDCYSLDHAGLARKIDDTASFTSQHAESFTNIFAVHRTQPQPACA
jgi:FkbM family methyltransferase